MNKDIYKARQKNLLHLIHERYKKQGPVLLIGAFEQERYKFFQDSTFYYYTGIEEPGCLLIIDDECQATLYVPRYKEKRSKWVMQAIDASCNAAEYPVERIEYTGEPCNGYQASPLFTAAEYETLIKKLASYTEQKISIFTPYAVSNLEYIEQKFVIDRLAKHLSNLESLIVDIAPIIGQMRRKKTQHEIEQLYKATYIAMIAQEGVAHALEAGKNERDLEAVINFIFTENDAVPAFPSIVAAGKHSTILHYMQNNGPLSKGDLVVVDIGARYNYYCSDLTRTYPVSGKYSKRQAEVYEIVLETQEFIASVAQAGYWLVNKDNPDKSLHHLALKFLEEKGYKQYFTHGIGHFLGLDVHDVGDRSVPLEIGDVITIEPGIYIPEENLGIRIEDDYWIVGEGAVCLSEELFKSVADVEHIVIEKPRFKE